MSLLTITEIMTTSECYPDREHFARAIEAAVLKKLSEQNEPVAWRFSKGTITKLDSWPHGGNWQPLYLHPAPQSECFDAWCLNPYTVALQKSIAEDYVPKPPEAK